MWNHQTWLVIVAYLKEIQSGIRRQKIYLRTYKKINYRVFQKSRTGLINLEYPYKCTYLKSQRITTPLVCYRFLTSNLPLNQHHLGLKRFLSGCLDHQGNVANQSTTAEVHESPLFQHQTFLNLESSSSLFCKHCGLS